MPDLAAAQGRKRRLFFALWPPDDVRAQLVAVTRDFVDRCGGRPVHAESFHVTVAFLGAVPEFVLERVKTIGAALAASPFELVLDRIESWPRPGILCLTETTAAPALLLLASRLRFSLLEAQIDLSPQEFRPHVTLARQVRHEFEAPIEPVVWPAADIALMESQPAAHGSDYRILARWPLNNDMAQITV